MTDALAAIPLPVAIVAATAGGRRTCTTGTLTYVSFSPPLVATPLGRSSPTLELLRESGEFSLSLLGEEQADLAVRASKPSEGDRFAEQGIPASDPADGFGVPGVAGAAAILWCRLESTISSGARVVCIGRVEQSTASTGKPLVRFEGRYRGLGAAFEPAEEADYPL